MIACIRRTDNPDRYLIQRGRYFYYKRYVPTELQKLDDRAPYVRQALKTNEPFIARLQRDILEEADNHYWSSLLLKSDYEVAKHRYKAACARAKALGFSYKPCFEIANESLETVVERVQILREQPKQDTQIVDAVLGNVSPPTVTLDEVEKIFLNHIAPPLITSKSPAQKNHWVKKCQHTFSLLRDVIGNKDITEINRDDALRFYNFLMEKVAPAEGEPTRSASFGRKHLASARNFYREYFRYIGDRERNNPFDNLTFKKADYTSRPPFSLQWVKEKILSDATLAGLNNEARAILLTVIDTGARPGEICNLLPERIHLDAAVPHIEIAPYNEKGKRREIKTRSSIRKIPLIGMALAALQKHPNGFPRYQDKENSLSATLNKFFRENGLFPSEKHTIYSFRHLFEDRMKEAGIDHELRCILMGHALERPKYGSGGSLEWRHEELSKILIPFDPSIV